MGYKKPIKIVLALGIGAIVLYYIVQTLIQNADQLREYEFVFRSDFLIVSFVLLLVSHIFLPLIWKRILSCFNVNVGYADALEILFLSYLARYIPGKVFTVVSQVGLAKEKQISMEVSLTTAVIYQLLGVFVGFEVFILTFILWPEVALSLKATAVAAGLIVLIISTRTGVIVRLVKFAIRRIKGSDAIFELSGRESLRLQGFLLISWIWYAVALHFLLNAFAEMPFVNTLIIMGIQAISWLISYYVLIAPGGIGVREGVQIIMLKKLFLPTLSVLIPVVLRLWMTMGDVLIFLVGLGVRYGRRAKRPVL
ncbi:MAG: hypothetical protein GTO51_08020 [Candidatus Latescibacteria bacterium]|nr:hypothetical protein [Candidatus Latescibacterota bacterium]NIM21780.1 hypothetical protein [Candidatus Latescibacterota bacterium]NIM65918.1 hypothetical protein [Candidatus Latescibacterota bacterium]NIO02663.1 hypothetical protein [Candidatus Latescibacterota bacterium]NIO29644.1 hypothetical protein [Candidatus Latescibacterota bacterium]